MEQVVRDISAQNCSITKLNQTEPHDTGKKIFADRKLLLTPRQQLQDVTILERQSLRLHTISSGLHR